MAGFAWVTLATNDSYSLGALVLAHSLRRVGSQHDLVVLITPGVTESMRQKLSSVFNLVREVNVLDSKDEANLAVLARPELGITFTKLHCWRLTQYEKCVFVDADALIVRNCDELFEREELSAAPDVGWPDCFNSGVFVFSPSQQTFASLTSFAATQGSFDGADQGLLNAYFSDWAHKDISKHLPFIYNMCSTATYSYAPAFKQYGENVRIVHFIGGTKPWMQYFNTITGIAEPPPGCNHLQPLLQIWWNIFCDNVHPHLSDGMATSTMTTIWHDLVSFPSRPIPPSRTVNVNNPDEDTCTEEQLATPNFSEFKDPWENYSQHNDPFFKDKQQTDSTNQYYLELHKSSTDSSEVVSPDQCGVELSLVSSSTSVSEPSCPASEHEMDHCSLHTNENLQESRQESFSLQNELNQEFMEHNFATQRVYEHEYPTDAESNYLIEHIHEINSLCDFIERVHSEPDDHNHYTTHENHLAIHSTNDHDCRDQTVHNIPESNSSMARTLNDTRQTSNEQNSNNPVTTDLHIPSPPSIPSSCTNPDKVETQTTFNASPCVESVNGGMAAALSKLTIGEERNEEQRAIDDFMRKQNWEEGNIDYTGRDSFDNILKKINETLAGEPPSQPSPVKETRQPKKSGSKSSEVEAAVEESEVALPVLASEDQSESHITQGLPKDMCQENLEVISHQENYEQQPKPDSSSEIADCKIVPENIEPTVSEKDLANVICDNVTQPENVQTSVETTQEIISEGEVPQLTTKAEDTEAVEKHVSEVHFDVASVERRDEPSIAGSILSIGASASLIGSGIIADYPVPIQVAESVLQTEPKESVTEDPKPIVESVITSIIPPIQESAAAASETPMEPKDVEFQESHDDSKQSDEQPSTQENSQALAEPQAENVTVSDIEKNDSCLEIATGTSEVAEGTKTKLSVILPQTEAASDETSSSESNLIQPSTVEDSELLTPASMDPSTLATATSTEESPVRPSRSKDLKIPGTPIITGPTPPTSPPLEHPQTEVEQVEPSVHAVPEPAVVETPVETSEESQLPAEVPVEASVEAPVELPAEPQVESQQAAAKMVKKSSTESDSLSSPESESTDKKSVKKVVKKVAKKPKEGEGEGSSTADKPKKVVKKKVLETSSSTSLEAEATVPETPPPPTGSDVPVPPKRKAKSAKPSEKKSD